MWPAEYKVSKRVKIGVAGAGVFGCYHASKYAAHDSADLVAIFDLDSDRAAELAGAHGAAAIGDFDGFLDKIDAAVIATPAVSHFDLALAALSRGRHVFVEKPLALSLGDADRLVKEAEARGRVLQVGHQERYVFDAAGLLNWQTSPKRIECWRMAPATGRGLDVSAVYDLMVHDLDLVRQLTAADVRDVSASGDADETEVEIVLSNGASAHLAVNRNAATLRRGIKLEFEDGVIEFDFVDRKITNSTATDLSISFDAADAPLAFRDPLAYGADRFLAAILEGADPTVSGRCGRAAIEWATMIEQAKISSDRQAQVRP